MKIRVVKTASKAKAVQVVRYQNNKRIVMQHIGSAHTAEALGDLMIIAEEWKGRNDWPGLNPAEGKKSLPVPDISEGARPCRCKG